MTIEGSFGLEFVPSLSGDSAGEKSMLIIEFEKSVSKAILDAVQAVVSDVVDPASEFRLRSAPKILGVDEVWLTLNGVNKKAHKEIREKLAKIDGFVSLDTDFSGTPERATLVYGIN